MTRQESTARSAQAGLHRGVGDRGGAAIAGNVQHHSPGRDLSALNRPGFAGG
jgi:hypothetical protein